jgi:hypothetical protein
MILVPIIIRHIIKYQHKCLDRMKGRMGDGGWEGVDE